MTSYRNDGLDNPLSTNGSSLSWSVITNRCDDCDAVREYEITSDGSLVITWVDGQTEEFASPEIASRAIDVMSRT